jgi:DNA-binding NarL/FixJ family response regulator
LVRGGCSNIGIGRRLGITERTAKFHVISILEKLEAPDRAAAVARAFDLGILRTTPTETSP